MCIGSWNGKCPLKFLHQSYNYKNKKLQDNCRETSSQIKNKYIYKTFISQNQMATIFHWKEHCTSLILSMCNQRKIQLMEWWNPPHSPSVSFGNQFNLHSQINESPSKWLKGKEKEKKEKEKRKGKKGRQRKKNIYICPHALKTAINLSLI